MKYEERKAGEDQMIEGTEAVYSSDNLKAEPGHEAPADEGLWECHRRSSSIHPSEGEGGTP